MWKKSEVWKNRAFQVLLIVELLLLLVGIAGVIRGDRKMASSDTMVISLEGGSLSEEAGEYYVDGTQGVSGEWLQMKGFSLSPGVYEYRMKYETSENAVNSITINASGAGFRGLMINEAVLYSKSKEISGQFYVTEHLGEEEELYLSVNYYGTEPLTVSNIEVVKTSAGSRIFIFWVVLFSLLSDSLFMLYIYVGKYPVSREWKLVWFGIPILASLASIPIFVDYIIIGNNFEFYMYRIEFLAKTLNQGDLTVPMESAWFYEYNCANALFGSDTFLLLPALLRLIGFSMKEAYSIFIFAVNLATAIVAYVSFRGMFCDKLIGMLGCMLYTLAPYRICVIYQHSAVGEYTALIFLPFICYGFYLLLIRDTQTKRYRSYWLVLVLGFTGMMQSNILSGAIMYGFGVLLCALCVKRVFRKETLWQFVKVVLGTVLVNLWFLLRLLDKMASAYGFLQNADKTTQVVDTKTMGIGVAILSGCVVFLYVYWEKRKDNRDLSQMGVVAFILGVIAVTMSTCCYSWAAVQSWNAITGTLVSMLQSPVKLTMIASVCLTVVACVAGAWMQKADIIKKQLFFGTVILSCIFFSMYQTNTILYEQENIMRIYTMESTAYSDVINTDYIP